MLRVVPPERLSWSKEPKGANRTSNKENATSVRSSAQDNKRTDPHPPRPNGGMSVRKFAGPPTADLSSVDNLRGSRPSEGQRSRPFKAMQSVQVEGKNTAETLNPKHKRRVSLKDLCAADKQRVRQLVEELARVTAEKEKVEGRLAKERRRFERALQQMEQERQSAMQERAHLEQSLQETQLQLQMASSRPYHEVHSQSLATSMGHPPHWLTGTTLAKTSSFYNSMQNGCPQDAPSSSEESVQMRVYKPAQHSQPEPAARFELYPSTQSESGGPAALGARQEVGSTAMKRGLPPTPLAPLAQMCDVGTGTESPCVAKGGTPPLVGQLAASRVSVSTQTASTVGTQTLSPRGEETVKTDLATCLMPQSCPPSSQLTHPAMTVTLTHPLMGRGDSKHSGASQPGGEPPQHALSEPMNHPSTLHTAVNHPSTLHTAVNHPSTLHTAVNHPSTLHTAVNQPSTLHTAVNHSSTLHTAVNHPSTLHTAVNHPSTLHTAVNHPSTLHTAVNHPSTLHTAVNHPSTLHTEESHHWGAMLATALQSARSTLGTNELGGKPNMDAHNESPPPTLAPAWEADVIEALNNTSLHTVASWAGPHDISTPLARRREKGDPRKPYHCTDAVQDKDLLEELFFLR